MNAIEPHGGGGGGELEVRLTTGELRVAQPQLQTGGGRTLFSAIWRIQEQPQLQLQGVQHRLDQRVVGLI